MYKTEKPLSWLGFIAFTGMSISIAGCSKQTHMAGGTLNRSLANLGLSSLTSGATATTSATSTAPNVSLSSASVNMPTIASGGAEAITANVVSNVDLSNLIGEIRVLDSKNNVVDTGIFNGINLVANQSYAMNYTYLAPSNATEGTYSVVAALWSSDWSVTYLYAFTNVTFQINNTPITPAATTVSVSSASVSSASISAGQAETIQASVVSNTNLPNANIEVIVADQNWNKIDFKAFGPANFVANQAQTFTYNFQSASNLAAGTYVVLVGVWSADWATTYLYGASGVSFTVGAAAPAPAPSPSSSPTGTVTPAPSASPTSGATPQPSASAVASGNNPLGGAKFFINDWTGPMFNLSACSQMSKIAYNEIAAWFGGGSNPSGELSDLQHYVGLGTTQNAVPVYVFYNIPNRDCGSYSSGGAAASAYPGWIQSLMNVIGKQKAVIIVEPDALPDVAGAQTCFPTQAGVDERINLIGNAVTTIKSMDPNALVYLDAGNPSWVDPTTMAATLQKANIAQADGFSLNVSNYVATDVNITYGTQISNLLGGKHFVIDTGENGNGAGNSWCNPPGRALGPVPQGFYSGLVDAYLWVKGPGGSDGPCNGGNYAGYFQVQVACDMAAAVPTAMPTYVPPASTPAPAPSAAPSGSSQSADGAAIPPASKILDASGGAWTVASGVVYLNGSAAGYSSNVTLLLYKGGKIYQENSAGGFWYWDGSTWVGTTDPRATTSPSPTPTASSSNPFAGENTNPNSITLSSTDGAIYNSGSYFVENNEWGAGSLPAGMFSQSAGIGPIDSSGAVSARWTWNCPNCPSDPEVKGFPAVGFGQKPGYGTNTASGILPKLANNVVSAVTSWDVQSTYTGVGHLSYDIWLSSDANMYSGFNNAPITHEIMIAVDPFGGYAMSNPAWAFDTVTIDGLTFTVWKADNFPPGAAKTWRFIVFNLVDPSTKALISLRTGSIEFKHFIDYMKSKGLISGSEYVSSFEFGNEMVSGTGDVFIKSFSVNVK